MKIIIGIIVLLLPIIAYSGEHDDKVLAAERYAKITPMKEKISDSAQRLSLQLPLEQREMFITMMTERVDLKLLEKTAIEAMVNTFTLEEINAFADFYGSEVGRSAMKKFGIYTATILPVMQKEIQRALATFSKQEQRK